MRITNQRHHVPSYKFMIENQFCKKRNIPSKCQLTFRCPDRNHQPFSSAMLQVGLKRNDTKFPVQPACLPTHCMANYTVRILRSSFICIIFLLSSPRNYSVLAEHILFLVLFLELLGCCLGCNLVPDAVVPFHYFFSLLCHICYLFLTYFTLFYFSLCCYTSFLLLWQLMIRSFVVETITHT